MGDEWQTTTLGNIVKEGGGFIQTGPFGSQLHASDYTEDGIPVIMPANISNNRVNLADIARIREKDANRLSKHIVKSGDIIYSRRGDVTRKALIKDAEAGMFCGTGCLLVRPGDKIDPRFLAYHLSTPENQEWIVRHAIGATMANLNTGILSSVPLKVPGTRTQKAIAHILGTLDDKIEINRKMSSTLEAMAQALFKSWFVDFDPVIDNALAAGNAIPEELQTRAEARVALDDERKSLPEEIQEKFPSRFVFTDEMGWVPEGWVIGTLDSIIDLIGGGTPRTTIEDYWGGNIPWFSVVDAPRGTDVFVLNTEKTITEKGLNSSSARLLRKGTTIISARGTVGKCAVVGQPMAINQSCYGIIGKEGFADYYVYYTILLRVADLQQRCHGSVFNTITRNTFKSIRLPICPSKLTQFFDLTVEPYLTKIFQSNFQTRSLAQIRDTLLPKLFSGELRVNGDLLKKDVAV